ncbi:ABC transporter substrate-binding protein [Rhodovastum atsumiense]|uniref:ABC transporter substrate-binding protein n=2 Tax=Rhodovastum atsumiense TaxID=504468 RepID=A0A5M6INE0_9PROT|nr:ABC transporter substrate-binding protein [Rhodovastum atsumiense]
MRPLLAAITLVAVPLAARAEEAPLRVVAPWDVASLEPSRAGYVFTRMQVAETLIGVSPQGLPEPALATSWSVAPDGLSWLLVLRRATFHDGAPVTPGIVVANLMRARAQPGPFAAVPFVAAEPDGEDAVILRLSEPFAALPAFLAHYSMQILAPSGLDATGAVRRVVGTGPYRVTELGLPLRVEVARNEAWTGGPAPAIARASYLGTPRAEARALMAESGQADLAFTLDPPSITRLRNSTRARVVALPIPRVETLKLNAGSAFFADARVRRAISLGIDRAGIARAILGNPDLAATQLFPPALAEWHLPGLPPLRRDPAAAARLLAEAGWSAGTDGVLVREGRPFRVTLRTYSDRPELPLVAAAIQDQLRILGIDVRIAIVNSSEIPAGHKDGTLEMALMARNFGLVPDPLGTLLQDFGPEGGDWGAMGWSSPALTATLARLRGTPVAAEERARLRGRVAALVQEALPVVPVAWYEHTVAVSRSLDGVVVDPFEISYNIARMRRAR